MAAPARAAASVRTAAAREESKSGSAVTGAVVCLGADKALLPFTTVHRRP
jgi:hypothetical protein